jgi:hypothetical protein
MMIGHNQLRVINSVKHKLGQAARQTAGMSSQERSQHMHEFWLSLPAHESEIWRRCVLKPGWARWESGMTPVERVEQRAKIRDAALAEDRQARARAIWRRRSKNKRRAIGEAIGAGLDRYWATATLEQRRAKTRAANAAQTREQRSARMKAWRARQRKEG